MRNYFLFALSCLVLFGCSSRPPLTQDIGKGTIIVLCDKGTIDPKVELPLMCNNRLAATMQAGTYCEMELLDGPYSLQIGDADPAQASIPQKVDVNLGAGGVKYFEIGAQAGAAAGTMTLSTVSAGIASTKISKLTKVSVISTKR
jgi:hypothetical protein